MANEANKYDRDKHDDYVICPRTSCQSRNAPPESDDFEPRCWNCNEYLNIQPVNAGDTVTLDITDIHESGAGVGHTDDGFVVLVDGVLPEKRIQAEIKRVHENHAKGELVETVADEIPEETDETDEETDEESVDEYEDDEEEYDDERLGSREDWWG